LFNDYYLFFLLTFQYQAISESLSSVDERLSLVQPLSQPLLSSTTTTMTATPNWPVGRRPKTPSNVGRIAGVPKSILNFDTSLIFEPVSYREIAAEAIREFMMERDLSPDPDVRQMSHFEGYMQPQEFNQALARVIPDEDIQVIDCTAIVISYRHEENSYHLLQAMKSIGYRIMEFGKFNWDDVVTALQIYKEALGDLEVPLDFVIDELVLEQGLGFEIDDGRLEELQLGYVCY